MLRGHLDSLISSGYFEGWAYDPASPAEPLLVAVLDNNGAEVAYGLAHLFREDLVSANCGIGWCAFRIRAAGSVSHLRKSSFQLVERSNGQLIAKADRINYFEAAEIFLENVVDAVNMDPTCIKSVDQLTGCEAIMNDFIRVRGVDAFVRTAYTYVLGRPADTGGLGLYGNLIRKAMISPHTMLQALANSAEFHSRPRSLVAPNMDGFPFRAR